MTRFLVDKSALARMPPEPLRRRLEPIIEAGARLTVLHYDGDYDTIAEVTGQPMEWVAPKGSL